MSNRTGISLLEVLFSMFVLTVGLLGLATLVPVGQFQVSQATHLDTAAVIARSAMREYKVRDMMDSTSWVTSGAAYTPTAPRPFIIDGLGYTNYSYDQFPYDHAIHTGSNNFLSTSTLRLDRISIKDIENGTNITTAQADRIFRLTDDKVFSIPEDATLRPILVNSAGSPQQQSKGEYTWMVMVAPLVYYDNSSGSPTATFQSGLGRINIIAFHRRDLVDSGTPASERSVWGEVNYSGQGTLDLTLTNPSTMSLSNLQEAKKAIKLLPGEWVMISGGSGAEHAWYRVVAASEVELKSGTTYQSDVTLAGPDVTFTDADSGNSGTQVVCTICDGVIGVFERTVQLDEPSLWTTH